MVLDATLAYIQHYKVRIKGKVEQSRESSSPLALHLGVVAFEKGAFGSLSATVGQLYNFLFYLHIHIFWFHSFNGEEFSPE